MNMLCHPRSGPRIAEVLGVEGPPEFGVGGGVPRWRNGKVRADESELDLVFRGTRGRIALIGEAKLTEQTFSSKRAEVVESYVGIDEMFDLARLPRLANGHYVDYQLIRNLLAARYHQARFVLIHDSRRPDLLGWHSRIVGARRRQVMPSVRTVTWQELAEHCTPDLQEFLGDKYGIFAQQP